MTRLNPLARALAISASIFVTGLSAFAQTAVLPPTKNAAPDAQPTIPTDNLAYPVLVQIAGVDSGSGFYLYTGTSTYLVTAKHVLFNEKGELLGTSMTLLSYPRDPQDTEVNLVLVDLKTLLSNGDVIASPTEDVAVVRTFTFVAPQEPDKPLVNAAMRPSAGVAVVRSAKTGIVSAPTSFVKKYADVFIGNDIIVYGYPTSIGLKQIPQLDPTRPLLRHGIIAGSNPATKSIVIDCPIYPGNSGGPVIEVDSIPFGSKFKIIGVVTQFVPFAKGSPNFYTLDNSGYAIVAPMDGVLDLIK